MLKVKTLGTLAVAMIATAALTAQAPKPAATKPAGQEPKPKPAAAKPAAAKAAPNHVLVTSADIKWGPAPDGLPPGAQLAVLDGDPGKAGVPFTIRAKLPDGYKVMPHWHPTDESVTVLSGTFTVGMGDTWNDSAMTTLKAGEFARMTKMTHHYAGTKGRRSFRSMEGDRSESRTSTRKTIREKRGRSNKGRSAGVAAQARCCTGRAAP